MVFSRFGASKYRNAVPHVLPREEWYRTALPPASSSSSTSSTLSTFSSEIKTNREWIVTVTQAGDLSYRGYEGSAGTLKVGSGGGVGDWDLGRLEGGLLAIGGLDGAVAVYSLPSTPDLSESPTLIHTIPGSSSFVTTVTFHPTTPGILLVSTVASPISIYDLSSFSGNPTISLNTSEPKGLWSVAWSQDGRRVSAVGRSGTGYVWEPRVSKDPIFTKALPIQPLKPARIVWVGDDLFLCSFSKTRSRQYSLLSSSLSTTFTQSLDTNPGTLIPLVDEERRIVYTAGRGDMTIRQVELSGPAGYQETLHPLPFPLASASLALVHPARLDVMKAEIGRILIPVVDKDGDALLPLGINVPRRQLIDYHDDLYPDLAGTIPEQTSQDWFNGDDKAPLPISLDPSRRGVWEAQVAKLSSERGTGSITESMPTTAIAQSQSEPSVPSPATPIPTSSADNSQSTAIPAPAPSVAESPKFPPPSATKTQTNPALPPLHDDETYASTSYKARILSDFIATQVADHRKTGGKSPLMVGLQGPQGCGKTTLCNALVSALKQTAGLQAAVLSLDDLYKTHDGLKNVAQQHPDNPLLAGRGPPGTHDIDLAVKTLETVKTLNESNTSVDLPIFDKSLCGGEGDRSSETVKIKAPIDVFILEGWSMGFGPLTYSEVVKQYDNPKPASPSTSKNYSSQHSLHSLETLNSYLSEFASAVYPFFTAFIQIEPVSYDYVFKWRLEQERNMKANNGGKGMTDEQVQKFVERYMPGYELWKEGIFVQGTPWESKSLRLEFGEGREVMDIKKSGSTVTGHDAGKEKAKPAPVTQVAAPSSTAPAKQTEKPSEPAPVSQEQSVPSSPMHISPSPPTWSSASVKTLPQARFNPGQTPFNPNWSRKLLGGKSPLIPSYDSVPALSSLHQDSKVLKCTAHLALFPVQGTGGRLGVHPLKKKGRMVTGGEGYLAGGVEIVDFDAELGPEGRVAVAGEDGVIRVWKVSPEGVHGVGPEPDQVLKGKGIDRFTQIHFHPTAKDLLVGVTNDHGKPSIRFWDLITGEEARRVEVPSTGVFNAAFNPEGDRVAVATKDGKVLVFDPRNVESISSCKAHDSPRSFQIEWIDSQHLVTVGFSRGSQRKINLYRLPSTSTGEVTTISSLTIDVSPSVLFPVYDPDTSILYVWGKGERLIQAFEVHPENDREPLTKLPSYTAGSPQLSVAFFPKRMVDVKKIEVAKALRLTAKTIEEVTFSIPRNKPDFFQDDIYQSTIDIETPVLTAAQWLSGENAELKRIDLAPPNMTPLSQAPQTTSAAKKKFVPASDVLSEEAKKKKEMDELFAKAKMDESSDEEEETKHGLDPPDDDW
ncbi:hypothetical protein CI109_100201 [Kwoniella shandongensis]|uniref:Uncharacterized protein n=1 Tax=Kwoniella shandongensis TaxID=1734106 RepID=A0A5M6BSY0_9TREE|nr:uncharacterized protein CI109_005800 [Kwoniella shandongensis]KAA5525917.1 hypothetical protein CI109_005800 [Kwoniella shandongensis]